MFKRILYEIFVCILRNDIDKVDSVFLTQCDIYENEDCCLIITLAALLKLAIRRRGLIFTVNFFCDVI